MTRVARTKFLPAALALVSFGLVFSAPAFAQDPDQPAEPDAPEQAPQEVPEEAPLPTDEAPDALEPGEAAEEALEEQRAVPTEEEKARYERYCKLKDAEPSHSDKQFCEEYRAKYGARAAGGPTPEERQRYERYCKLKDAEPSHSDKQFCEEYRRKYGGGEAASASSSGGERPAEQTQPAAEESDDEPDSGPLAFTGLDVWQLVLLALVLLGGGLAARRLLTS